MWSDFVLTVRQFRRQPSFALAVVFTLALTIGANIAVFSIVNAVLLRALPFRDPERLFWIVSVRPDNPIAPFTVPEFMDYRSQTRTLSGLAAYAYWRANFTGTDVNEGLQGARVSANLFDLLGVTPVAGRLLSDSDDRSDAPRVVVLSYQIWQRRFSGTPGIVGTTLRLNGESFLVVGVLPLHFPLPLRDVEVFVPLLPDRDPYRYVRSSTNFLRFIGRLNPGVSKEQAQAELTTICRSLRQQFPIEYARKQAVRTVDLREALIGDYRQSMLLSFAAVLVVLGTALANLVSLVLVRANARRFELSIRVAIGASRLHLLRQMLIESLALVLAGSGLGWMLAKWMISSVVHYAPDSIPRLMEVSVDGRVFGFAVLTAGIATVLLTLASLGVVLRAQAGDALRSSRGSVGDRWNGRVRQALVVAEIAGALILVLATTVLVQNLLRLQDVRLGFRPDSVLQVRISLPPMYKSADDLGRFYDLLRDRLINLPGVESVGVTSTAPLSGLTRTVPFRVDGDDQLERDLPNVNLLVISPDYLSAVGSRLLSGRSFSETDASDKVPVALVSSTLAERYLHRSPLGRRLLISDNSKGPRPVEIVGVVEDVRQASLDTPSALDVYIPLRQVHPEHTADLQHDEFWLVRTATNPAAFRSTFQDNLRAVDADAAVSNAGTMREYVDAALGPRRFNVGLFAAFSCTGVVLAVLGVYGLVSYIVSQRQREIGLRMALGATEGAIHRLILRQAVALGLAGAVLGCCFTSTIWPLVSRLKWDISIGVPSAIATGLLLVVIVLAGWLPARRAVRVSPTLALRGE
jgi:putative ABC transport system permease protein